MASLPFISVISSLIVFRLNGFNFFLVNSDATVGANNAARGASYAIVGIDRHCKGIASSVYLLRRKRDYVFRTGYYAEAATLATSRVNYYHAFDFCHLVFGLSSLF